MRQFLDNSEISSQKLHDGCSNKRPENTRSPRISSGTPENTMRKHIAIASLTITALVLGLAAAQNKANISIGRNNYLFQNLDGLANYSLDNDRRVDKDLELIAQINKVLSKRNIQLTFALVPMVQRVYPEQLPESFKTPARLNALYDRALGKLNAQGVNAPNINARFQAIKTNLEPEFGLYMRQDNHWSSIGAREAANLIANSIKNRSAPSLTSLPVVKSNFEWLEPTLFEGNYYKQLSQTERNQVVQERIKPFRFTPVQSTPVPAEGNLLGSGTPGIALTGTSFSHLTAFGFADGLAHFLERDVLNTAKSGVGPWSPLLEYLQSDAYQNTPPKLLIWEMPEEHLVPGYPPLHWKDIWTGRQYLLELAANINGDCRNAGSPPVMMFSSGFTTGETGTSAQSDSTTAKSFVKYQFAKPIRTDQYLSLKAKSASSDSFLIESASTVPHRYFSQLRGYGITHRVNVPLDTLVDGITRSLIVRIAPGSDFTLEDVKLCTMPSELSALAKLVND
jgi:alginate O-acetyltransferase complex protein AlgJ